MCFEIRWFHTGDFANNRSVDYLRNGARHAQFETVTEARQALQEIDAYQKSVGTCGRFEYDGKKIVAWCYATSDWGMRYWIVDNGAAPVVARDLSQTALDFAA